MRFEQVLKMEIVNVISTLMETAVEDVARQNVPFVLHRQHVQLFTYHGQLDRMEGVAREDLGVEAGVDHCCLNRFMYNQYCSGFTKFPKLMYKASISPLLYDGSSMAVFIGPKSDHC